MNSELNEKRLQKQNQYVIIINVAKSLWSHSLLIERWVIDRKEGI